MAVVARALDACDGASFVWLVGGGVLQRLPNTKSISQWVPMRIKSIYRCFKGKRKPGFCSGVSVVRSGWELEEMEGLNKTS